MTKGSTNYTWTRGRLLASVGDTTFEYDYKGKRTKKGTTEYYYDGDKLIAEVRPTGTLYFFYDESGVCGMRCNGANYEFVRNIFGDVIRIYDVNGDLKASYTYDTWGNCTIGANVGGIATINPFRYRGYYYDTETNLYYLQTRYYDPSIGQFISPDTQNYLDPQTIGGVDLYAYCNNNPVMGYDPTGHFFWGILSAVVQIVATTIAVMTDLVQNGGTNLKEDLDSGALNPFNTSEETVLNSKVMSFYKGSLVIRHDIPKATSCGIFGTIFLNKKVNDATNLNHTNTLKHEWGHNQQEKILGASYLIFVALPSLYYNQTGDYRNYKDEAIREQMYYSKIWERTADWLGGVDRQNYYDFWDWRNFVPW